MKLKQLVEAETLFEKHKATLEEMTKEPLPFKYTGGKSGTIIATFKSKRDLYMVFAMERGGAYELGFNVPGAGGLSAVSRGESEKGNVFGVLATVKAIFKKWLDENKPKFVFFSTTDKPAMRHKIFERGLRQFGYKPDPKTGFFKRMKK